MKRIEVINEYIERMGTKLYEISQEGWTREDIIAIIDSGELTEEEVIALVLSCRLAITYTNLEAREAAETAAKAYFHESYSKDNSESNIYKAQSESERIWLTTWNQFDHIGRFKALCIENNG